MNRRDAVATRADGSEVMPGDEIVDFRGNVAVFAGCEWAPAPSTGRVLFFLPGADYATASRCYPSVFGLTVSLRGPTPFSHYKVRRPLAVNPGFRCATCGAGFDCGDGCRCPD